MVQATYGHGTHNDFVLVFDEGNKLTFSADQIKRICDRKDGIGSDGFIKIVKKDDAWFMDYSNADGSVAEMCGNGIRVMARYLTDRGHQPSGIYAINTRAGRKFLSVPDSGDISVNMGQVSQVPGEITVEANHNSYQGFNIGIGNPHAVVVTEDIESGVGETQSCGTGTCAVALAATIKNRKQLPIKWVINPPGGKLIVEIDVHSNATLTGPAVLIKDI